MDKQFYIIGIPRKTTGLMAIVLNSLCYIICSLNDGFIPVIDMKHYINQYFKDNRIYKDNSWEYYFEQPFGYTLNDIDENCDVTISRTGDDLDDIKPPTVMDLPLEMNDYKQCNKLQKYKDSFKKYIKFNSETKKYLEEKYQSITGGEENILGVFARGTDYKIRKTVDHPVQPNNIQIINKIKTVLKKYPEIKKIYLATEDLDIYNKLKSEFKDMIIDNGQYRISYKNKENKYKFLSQVTTERENHNYNLGLEYLTSLYILSKCKYFIGGRTAGSMGVYYMSKGFKYSYWFNLGRYGKGLGRIYSVVTETTRKHHHKVYTILGLKFKVNPKKEYFKNISGGGTTV